MAGTKIREQEPGVGSPSQIHKNKEASERQPSDQVGARGKQRHPAWRGSLADLAQGSSIWMGSNRRRVRSASIVSSAPASSSACM
jgi:hypothetical protein